MTVRLGLRLAVAGGRESLLRLALTAVGVGVGVLLLLLSLTGQSAAQGRAERSGWRSADSTTPATAPDAALFLSVTDYHDGTAMARAYVAALGPRPPVPPGLERLPGPGEVAVSPAMRRLLESTPDDQLDDRYPGRVTATIGDAGLAHPDELVALIGRTPDYLGEVRSRSVQEVRGFGALPSGYAYYLALRVSLLVGAVLLLVPVVVFIVMATRVAAAQREQRLAAIRLVGATRLQAAVVAAVETGLAAVAGSALGWAGYEVGRRVLAATVTYQGGRFFVDDVVVAPWLLLLVLLGVPVLATLTTIAALSRVQVGPLAASRRAHRPPSAWRALPFAVGVGGQLAAVPLRGVVDSETLDNLVPLFVIATIVGFVAIGPWLCMLAGRGMARVSRRVPGLIAARRVAADPRATFRAVSGVVLAVFAVTYSASLVEPSQDRPRDGTGVLRPGVVEVYTGGVPEAQVAPLLSEQAVASRLETGTGGQVVESCPKLARVVTLPVLLVGPRRRHPRAGRARRRRPAGPLGVRPHRWHAGRREPRSHPGRQPRAERDHPHPAGPVGRRRALSRQPRATAACVLVLRPGRGGVQPHRRHGRRRHRAAAAVRPATCVRPPPRGPPPGRVPRDGRDDADHRGGGCGAGYGVVVRPGTVPRHGVDMAGRRRLRHGRHRRARRPDPLDDGPPAAGRRHAT
jgi:hypothetical protein